MCPSPPPEPPQPPNRIRQRSNSPSACQKVIRRQPNSGGSSQFQRCITSSPPMKVNRMIPAIAAGASQIHLFLMFCRSEEHTSELQSPVHLVCRLLLEKKKKKKYTQLILKNYINNHINLKIYTIL